MACSTRRSFLIGVGGATAASVLPICSDSSAALVEADAGLRPLIDRERQSILAIMEKEDIPGAAVGLIHDGRPIWIEGFGVTDHKSKRRVGTNTIFSIQSTSKNMTATAILLAVQHGLLDLDKPIAAYLPDFTVNSRFEGNPQDKITLRHLVSHRAGFTHEAPVGNNDDPTFPSFDAHVQSISQTWLRFPVGERYRYSNLGFDLAGYILQKVTKRPFASCIRTMLFDPLGMGDTTANTDDYVQRTNRAIGHQLGYETVPLRIPLIPSGGVYTSARDMATYMLFHLNRGKIKQRTLLEEKSWNEMHNFSFPGAYSLGIAGGHLRFGDTDIWMLNHTGGGFGFGCVFRFYPQARLGWIAMFNRQVGAAYQWGSALTDAVLIQRYGKRNAKTRIEDFAPAMLPREELQKFVGNWIGNGFTSDFKLNEGTLVTRRGNVDVAVRVISPDDIVIPNESPVRDATKMHYFHASYAGTAHMESALGDGNLDYNDGPNDLPGPNKEEWDRYVGDYWVDYWGKPTNRVNVRRKNGYLYLNEVRLVDELEPALFFTSDGEAVDFRHDPPTWRNIPLRRA